MTKAWLALGATLVLAACATPPDTSTAPGAGPAAAPPRGSEAVSTDSGLFLFEQRQREAAVAAMQGGRWPEAVWAWDVVLALNPGDASARAQREAALHSSATAATARHALARAARARGDLDSAVKHYLDVLAVAPHDAGAADALREIERARTRRGNVVVARTAPTPSAKPASPRNDLEHASLLAAQGEFDAAIAMLAPQALGAKPDPQARTQLADIYWRQALRFEARDRAQAIAALQRCLQLDPHHAAAAEKLKALRASGPGG